MVVTALAVVLLSRSDLPIATNPTIYQTGVALTPTGLEDIATYAVPMLIGRNSQKYFSVADTNPALFRQNMLRRCRAVANDVYAKSGPLGSLESVAIELGKPLIDFKKTLSSGDMTILQMLESTDHNAGIGANPKSIGLPQRFTAQLLRSITIERAPGFMIRPMKGALIGGGSGSADFSPVIYDTMSPLPSDGSTSGISSSAIFGSDASVSFARNEFTSVYAAAAAVLNVAFAPGTLPAASGKWAAVRLFPQGLPAVESALDEIMGWVKTIQSGVLGIVDLILTYIDFIEARILEIESLISRINGLLQQLLAFQMPQVSALITVGQGTDGILQGLMSAGDKPTDMSTSYGAGVVVLAGGLPTFLADILRAIFTAGSED